MNKRKTFFISVGILIIAGIVTTIIFLTEPTAQRTGATKETAMLVDVIDVDYGSFRPTFVSTGTVSPVNDINLSPRVSGQVFRLSRAFTPGGFVRKGEILLQIDPADYENTLMLRKSDLHQALADLDIEKGRQDVARMDYQLIGDTLANEDLSLVLRQPQLNAVKARVEAAEAAVKQAELDLQRTTIRAPFDAHILTRNVNVGSQVSPGDNLGRLVGMEEYWVVATVSLNKLRWLTFPDSENEKGSEVRIRNRTAWKPGEFRIGYLDKLVGALEDQTRLARLLVTVSDPLVYHSNPSDKPALMIGAFVETTIKGKEVQNVVRLNRDYVRNNETVWVMEDGRLRIRQVEILLNDAEYAYITNGLRENDQVVTTNLSTVTEGARLRLEGPDTTGQNAETAIE